MNRNLTAAPSASRSVSPALLPALCLAAMAVLQGPAYAAGQAPAPDTRMSSTAVAAPRAAEAPAPAAALPRRMGYVTQSGRQMPIYQFSEYQSARRRWFAGFIVVMSGLGLVATGVTAFIFGGAPGSGLSDVGRSNAMLVGGIFTGVGVATTAIGSVLWASGRQGVQGLERQLPMSGGAMPPSFTAPQGAISQLPVGSSFIGLSGRF